MSEDKTKFSVTDEVSRIWLSIRDWEIKLGEYVRHCGNGESAATALKIAEIVELQTRALKNISEMGTDDANRIVD